MQKLEGSSPCISFEKPRSDADEQDASGRHLCSHSAQKLAPEALGRVGLPNMLSHSLESSGPREGLRLNCSTDLEAASERSIATDLPPEIIEG